MEEVPQKYDEVVQNPTSATKTDEIRSKVRRFCMNPTVVCAHRGKRTKIVWFLMYYESSEVTSQYPGAILRAPGGCGDNVGGAPVGKWVVEPCLERRPRARHVTHKGVGS